MSDNEISGAVVITGISIGVLVVMSLVVGAIVSRAIAYVLVAVYCCTAGLIVTIMAAAALYFVTWPAVRQITAEIKNDYKEAKRENDEQ